MSIKRMRIFAGPNGSGKTSIITKLKSKIKFGVYVNADDIEASLNLDNMLSFSSYKIKISSLELQDFFRKSTFSPVKRKEIDLWQKLYVKENILYINTKVDSYLAADLADFIRNQLLENELSFTYETVMSHKSKIDFIKKAKANKYRVYLYYVATENPEINISRVNIRVAQHGHFVPSQTIIERYYKSLEQLKSAVFNSNRAYIWDNSGSASLLISEITNGIDVSMVDVENIPNWFVKYLIN